MSYVYNRNGIFWIAYRHGGKRYRQSLKTKDRTTAKYLQAKHDQGSAEGRAPILNADIQQTIEEYRTTYEHHKTKRTHVEDIARIQGYVSWSGIRKISEVSEKNLSDYFNHKITDEKRERNTVNRIMASLKTFLNFAVRRSYLGSNPMKAIKRYKLPENPPRFLTKEEIGKVLQEARKTDLYPCVATAIYTGMRKGELFNLEWTDVDFTRNVIIVNNKSEWTTKSKKARTIPIHPTLWGILKNFKQKGGRCFDVANQRRVFSRIIREARLGDDIGWHTLRHSFASALVMHGIDIVTVSKLLGHSSIATTMIYSHLTKDHEKAAISHLDF